MSKIVKTTFAEEEPSASETVESSDILEESTVESSPGQAKKVVMVKNVEECRQPAATVSVAEEMITKALSDWRKTKETTSPSPTAKRKSIGFSPGKISHLSSTNKSRRKSARLPVRKLNTDEIAPLERSNSFDEPASPKKLKKGSRIQQRDSTSPKAPKTPELKDSLVQESSEKENELNTSIGATKELEVVTDPLSVSTCEKEENGDEKIETEPPMRTGKKKQLNAYRRISQKFNRKSIMSPEKKKHHIDLPKKRRPVLQRQDSEMVLEIVNKKLEAEGKQGVNNAERKWILKNMGMKADDPGRLSQRTHSPASPTGTTQTAPKKKIKSKTEYINQLQQKLSMMELNLNEVNRRFETERDEKKALQTKLTAAEERIEEVEEENQKLKQTRRELRLKLETLGMNAEERDKFIEEMEQKMLAKLSKASERESKMAAKLKQSLSIQSKMETQLLQLRGDKTNLEHDRQEAFAALEKANNLVVKLQQNNSYLASELDSLRSSKENLQTKASNDKKDLEEAYEYISLLEDSDVKLRTAVALVNKQNKALSGINARLKQQLGEAQAQLAMQQFYDDMDEDIDANIATLTSAVWDEPEPEQEVTPRELKVPEPPPGPPPELVNILSTIPNYVASKRKQRAELIEKEDPVEMADIFAKALLQRRDKIADDITEEYSSDDEWEDSSE